MATIMWWQEIRFGGHVFVCCRVGTGSDDCLASRCGRESSERSHLHSLKRLRAGHRDGETLGGHVAMQACLVLSTFIDVVLFARSRQRSSSSKRFHIALLPWSGPELAVSPRRACALTTHASARVRPLASLSLANALDATSLTVLERQLTPCPFPSHPAA